MFEEEPYDDSFHFPLHVPKQLQTALLIVLLITTIVGFGLYVTKATVIQNVTEVWIQPPFAEAAYIVGQYNSTYYYAKNSTNGNYDWLSSNATSVANHVFAALSGTNWQTINLQGNFVLNGTLLPNSWTKIVLDGTVTLVDNTDLNILEATGKTHITITGGTWVGAAATQPIIGGFFGHFPCGMYFTSCSDVSVSNVEITNTKYLGIVYENSTAGTFAHLNVHDIGSTALGLNTYTHNVTITDIKASNIGSVYDAGASVVWVHASDVTINGITSYYNPMALQIDAFASNITRITASNIVFSNQKPPNPFPAIWIDTVSPSAGVGTGTYSMSDIHLSNINIDGALGFGIHVFGRTMGMLSRVSISDFSITNTGNVSENSYIPSAFFAQNVTGLSLSNGFISNVTADPTNMSIIANGIWLDSVQNSTIENVQLNMNNASTGILESGTIPYPTKFNKIVNCQIHVPYGNPIVEISNSTYNSYIGNSFWGMDDIGPWMFYNNTDYIVNNQGYNPVGLIQYPVGVSDRIVDFSNTTSTIQSGVTYTNWQSPKNIYIYGGNFSSVKINGETVYSSVNSTSCMAHLEPGQTFRIVWISEPAIVVMGE